MTRDFEQCAACHEMLEKPNSGICKPCEDAGWVLTIIAVNPKRNRR